MGDRTTCTLRLLGTPTYPEKLPAVIAALEAEGPGQIDDADVTATLARRWPYFVFHEINGGDMAENLKAALMAAGQCWWWAWEAGDQFPAGLDLYDAATREQDAFNTVDGQIALTFEDLRRPDMMVAALRWQGFIDSFFPLRKQGAVPEATPAVDMAVTVKMRYRCPGDLLRHRQIDHIHADMIRLLTPAEDGRVQCMGVHVDGIEEAP